MKALCVFHLVSNGNRLFAIIFIILTIMRFLPWILAHRVRFCYTLSKMNFLSVVS